MYANLVTTRFATKDDFQQALARLEDLVGDLQHLHGFRSFTMLRKDETTAVHISVYESAEDARSGREKMFPRFKEAIGPRAEAAVESGDVVITAEPAHQARSH